MGTSADIASARAKHAKRVQEFLKVAAANGYSISLPSSTSSSCASSGPSVSSGALVPHTATADSLPILFAAPSIHTGGNFARALIPHAYEKTIRMEVAMMKFQSAPSSVKANVMLASCARDGNVLSLPREEVLKLASESINQLTNLKALCWPEEARRILVYILNICLARIEYNYTFMNFYQNNSGADLTAHFEMLGLASIKLEKGQISLIRLIKQAAKEDVNLYSFIIKFVSEGIQQNRDCNELWDSLHDDLIKQEQIFARDQAESEELKNLEMFSAYYKTAEYEAGLESPHIQEMLRLMQPLCTDKHLTCINNFRSWVVPTADTITIVLIPIAEKMYFKDTIEKINKLRTEVRRLKAIDADIKLRSDAIENLNNLRALALGLQKKLIKENMIEKSLFEGFYDTLIQLEVMIQFLKEKVEARRITAWVPPIPLPSRAVLKVSDSVLSASVVGGAVVAARDSKEVCDVAKTDDSVSLLGPTPPHIKKSIIEALDRWARVPDFEEDEKESAETGFGQRQIKILLRVLFIHKPDILNQIFKKKVAKPLTMAELQNVVTAIGGRIENREGCRFRVVLNGSMGDIYGVKVARVSLPLHGTHGRRDSQESLATNLTRQLFANIFRRANILETYSSQIENFLSMRGVRGTLSDLLRDDAPSASSLSRARAFP